VQPSYFYPQGECADLKLPSSLLLALVYRRLRSFFFLGETGATAPAPLIFSRQTFLESDSKNTLLISAGRRGGTVCFVVFFLSPHGRLRQRPPLFLLQKNPIAPGTRLGCRPPETVALMVLRDFWFSLLTDLRLRPCHGTSCPFLFSHKSPRQLELPPTFPFFLTQSAVSFFLPHYQSSRCRLGRRRSTNRRSGTLVRKKVFFKERPIRFHSACFTGRSWPFPRPPHQSQLRYY